MDDDVGVDSDDDGDGFLQLGEEPLEDHHGNVPQIAEMQKVDPEAWREEVERITPQLKVRIKHIVEKTPNNGLWS